MRVVADFGLFAPTGEPKLAYNALRTEHLYPLRDGVGLI